MNMRRTGLIAAACAAASCLWAADEFTISARPGALNYVEGTVLLDGQVVARAGLKNSFLNTGSILETSDGRAELLLTPGVFLRVGNDSQVRMLKGSLLDTQLVLEKGDAMLEVDDYVRDNRVEILAHGASVSVSKSGLYRISAEGAGSVVVLEGKAEVQVGDKHTSLGRNKEVSLDEQLTKLKFDKEKPDDLYAWSNVRAQYNASLTYRAAQGVYNGTYASSLGFGGFYRPGWYWGSAFNSWFWMPGDAAFFSPFGWGFYGPSYIPFAPVVTVPVFVNRPTLGMGHPLKYPPVAPMGAQPAGPGVMTVPVNGAQMPAVGSSANSPAALSAARAAAMRNMEMHGGLRTGNGSPAPPAFNPGGGFPRGGAGGQHGAGPSPGSMRSTGGGAAPSPRSMGGGGGGAGRASNK